MICPSCGFKDEGRFCKHCGAPLVAEDVASHRQAPRHAGITLPPPSAEEGFKAEQMVDDGTPLGEEIPTEPEGAHGQGNSFGLFLVMLLVVAFVAFAVKMVGGNG
ncbi:MAG: hypothetical protein FJY99_03165 [Candidatus Sericytochromatia bacterium]|nr:hypothetical protein [Candidatus Tanganyikabacteria bacterium]